MDKFDEIWINHSSEVKDVETINKMMREAREGYVKLEDVLKIIERWMNETAYVNIPDIQNLEFAIKSLSLQSPQSAGDNVPVQSTTVGIVRSKVSIPDGAICKPETLADAHTPHPKDLCECGHNRSIHDIYKVCWNPDCKCVEFELKLSFMEAEK